MNRSIGFIVLLACLTWTPQLALGQAFPSRPVWIIVPFPPGITMDPVVRQVGERLSKGLGQPVLYENKPGGGMVIAIDAIAKSKPDGYTLGVVSNTFAANPTLVPKLPYNTLKDLRPVGLMMRTASVLVGHPGVPAKDLRGLIAYAKANPGKLSYASPGNGTLQHMIGESLKSITGVNMVHVPYKGTAISDLLGGHIDLVIANLPLVLSYIRAGKLNSFGVTTATRAPVAPELATVAEQGYPEINMSSWFGLVAPAAVPDRIVARLNTELVQALSSPEVRNWLLTQGFDPRPGTPEEFGTFIRSEIATYAKVIKEANIRLD